jgi:hypothetical protein
MLKGKIHFNSVTEMAEFVSAYLATDYPIMFEVRKEDYGKGYLMEFIEEVPYYEKPKH